MGRSHYRTYCLTGSVVTMLAGHRLEGNFGIVCRYLEFFVGLSSRWRAVIAVNSNPCHFTAVENFLLTHYGYVILDLTSYSTGATANTGVHVYGQTPVMLAVFMAAPQRNLGWLDKFTFMVNLRIISSCGWIFLIFR